jgi:GNAT superfamily N-acetyltransferase
VIDQQEAMRLQKRNLARFLRLLASGAPDSKLFERGGMTAAIVPAAPQRSILNSAIYTDAGELAEHLEDVAKAYERAGVLAWTVWAHEDDEAAGQVLAAAGHSLDGTPAAMSMELADFEQPEIGDLDWDSRATAKEIGELNDLAYGWSGETGAAAGLRDLAAGPTTHLYRARVDGATVSVAVIIDTDDEASLVIVATDEQYRGRGLSTRLVGAALAEARGRGMRTSTLQASAAGEPVYAGLGYRSFGRMQMWERRRT